MGKLTVWVPVALFCPEFQEKDSGASAPEWHRGKRGPSALTGLMAAREVSPPLPVCTPQSGPDLQSACSGLAAVGDP